VKKWTTKINVPLHKQILKEGKAIIREEQFHSNKNDSSGTGKKQDKKPGYIKKRPDKKDK
jgi:hypothetical protein